MNQSAPLRRHVRKAASNTANWYLEYFVSDLNETIGEGDVHEHRPDDPVVERGGQRCMQQECESTTQTALREERDGADIEHNAAAEREDDQLDDDESSNLA